MKLYKAFLAAFLLIIGLGLMSTNMADRAAAAGRYYTPTLSGTLNTTGTVDLGVNLLSNWEGAIALRTKHTTGAANVTMYLEESDWGSSYDDDIYWRTIDSIVITTGDFDGDSLAVGRIAATAVEGVRHRYRFGTVSDTVQYIIKGVYKLH
jgi:hypothetical protein